MPEAIQNIEDADLQRTDASLGTYRIAKSEHRMEKMANGTEREYRYVLGPVLIPDRLDLQKDWATKQSIEDGCHRFMRQLTVSEGHKRIVKSDDAVFVENYVMPVDARVGNLHIPQGTWMAAARIYNPELIQKIDSGVYRGFSIEGKAGHYDKDGKPVSM